MYWVPVGCHGERWFRVIANPVPTGAACDQELLPEVIHDTIHGENNRIEGNHGRLKARLRPMRGLRVGRAARNVPLAANLRRFEVGTHDLGLYDGGSKSGTTVSTGFSQANRAGPAFLAQW